MDHQLIALDRVFAQARELLQSDDDWLDDLEFDAVRGRPGWADRLLGYGRGLVFAGAIDIADIDDLDKLLSRYRRP